MLPILCSGFFPTHGPTEPAEVPEPGVGLLLERERSQRRSFGRYERTHRVLSRNVRPDDVVIRDSVCFADSRTNPTDEPERDTPAQNEPNGCLGKFIGAGAELPKQPANPRDLEERNAIANGPSRVRSAAEHRISDRAC
jgi:hypothetical protein